MKQKGLPGIPKIRVRKTAGTPRGDWATPQSLVDRIVHALGIHGFDLDVCAMDDTAKAPRWFTPAHDGLKQEWDGVVWCNPPFGTKSCRRWLAKGMAELEAGRCTQLAFLCSPRIDQKWWHAAKRSPHYQGTIEIEGRIPFEIGGVPMRGSNALTVIMIFANLPRRPVCAAWGWHLSLGAATPRGAGRLLL